MMQRLPIVLGCTVALLVGLAAPAPVLAAKKRIAFFDITGPSGDKTTKVLRRMLKDKHTLVSPDEVQAELKKNKRPSANTKANTKATANTSTSASASANASANADREPTPRELAAACAKLKIDVLIDGSMSKDGPRFALQLVVREGKTAKPIEAIHLPLRSARLDSKTRSTIGARLEAAIAKAATATDAAEQPGVATGPGRKPTAVNAGQRRPADGVAGKVGPTNEDSQHGRGSTESHEDEDEDEAVPGIDVALESTSKQQATPKTPKINDKQAIVVVTAGPSMVARRLSFEYDKSGVPRDNQPFAYGGKVTPAVLVRAEVYPLAALRKKPALAAIGFSAETEYAGWSYSKFEDEDERLPTTQLRWGVGLSYRLDFGDGPGKPSLKLLAGYDQLSFVVSDVEPDNRLPDASYRLVHAGARISVPLVVSLLSIVADARYLEALSCGEIESSDHYGSGSARGISTELSLVFHFGARLSAILSAHYVHLRHSFAGDGDLIYHDPATDAQLVTGATDEYLGAFVGGGVSF
ncbi:MAG: hypothetical protein V2A73_06555 [Pseudomonadota bacterium]